MDIAKLDLNLLVVFHHLLLHKRVSAVGPLLGMSQPAVSSALGRLRANLGDELFLRTQSGMEPTPYALQLAEPFGDAVGDAISDPGRKVRPIADPDPCAGFGPRIQPGGFLTRAVTGLYVPEINTGAREEAVDTPPR